MVNLTIVLTTYKRPQNVKQILKALSPYHNFMIINNNPNKNYKNAINNKTNRWCIDRWHKIQWHISSDYVCILDDDILPTPDCLKKMLKVAKEHPFSLVGVYGKSRLEEATKYEDLDDYWCVDKEVDLVIGACIITRTQNIHKIYWDYIEPWGIQDRGDDLLVSMSLSHKYNVKHYTVGERVLHLPEMGVALSGDPLHYSKRWNVIQDFRRKYNG